MDKETQALLKAFPTRVLSVNKRIFATHSTFSKQKYLKWVGDKLYGGWNTSFGGACFSASGAYLRREQILDMRDLGACADGDGIVMCDVTYSDVGTHSWSTEAAEILESLPTESAGKGEPHVLTFTDYSKKELIHYCGNYLCGGWAPSFGGACFQIAGTVQMQANAVIRMKDIGTCEQGSVIVMCEHY